ncbi:hypothetical protein V3C99_010128 [Haemonchus contortus]
MPTNTISVPYQVLYIVFPTISILANTLIICATVLSRELRNPCNIFIALMAVSDIMLMFSFYTTVATYKLYKDHVILHEVCVYFNIVPFFCSCLSIMLLLNLAVDRLLSLTSLYRLVSCTYAKLYIAVQVLPGCIFGVTVDILMIINRKKDKDVLCTISAPLLPPFNEYFIRAIFIICVLIVFCYSFFALFLRRVNIRNEVTKTVYQSLIVNSMTMLCGTFGGAIVAMTDDLHNPSTSSILLVGIFINVGTAVNFFSYYFLSSQYREVFDKVLGIGRLKNAIFPGKLTPVHCITHIWAAPR